MTNVPLLDLKAQFAQIRAEVMPLIEQVCASQQFILGEQVRGLEEEVARYCGASFGVGVSSGTDALLLALMALGILLMLVSFGLSLISRWLVARQRRVLAVV